MNKSSRIQDVITETALRVAGKAPGLYANSQDENDMNDDSNCTSEEEKPIVRVEEQQQEDNGAVEPESALLQDTCQPVDTPALDIRAAIASDERDLQTREEEEEPEEFSEKEFSSSSQQLSSSLETDSQLGSPRSVEVIDYASQEKLLNIRVLVKHRVQDILKSRVSLQDCGLSKFFFFLPILEDATTPTEPAASAPSQPTYTTTTKVVDQGLHGNTKYQLYFICDCGDIPGFENIWHAHWRVNDSEKVASLSSDENFSQDQLEELIPLVGDYMMGVLEMLMHGVYVDKAPQAATRRISLAIEYLQSKGIRSCEDIMSEVSLDTGSVVNDVKLDRLIPIAPLDNNSRTEVQNCIFSLRTRKHPRYYLCRVSMGDVRRLCQFHLFSMLPQNVLTEAQRFSVDPSSTASNYDYRRGVFSSRITSMRRAREFFQLAAQMPSIPTFRVSLEWGLSAEDEQEVADAIGGLTAVVVQLTVPTGTGAQRGAVSGCADGFELLIFAALRNSKVEDFAIFKRSLDTGRDYPEFLGRRLYDHSSTKLRSDTLAVVSRGMKDCRMRVALRARNARQAIASVRRAARGLHNLSELHLQVPGEADLTINLAGSHIEDTDYTSGELLPFFMKRHGCDGLSCLSPKVLDTAVSQLGCLTEAKMGISLEEDRSKVRDLIKLNEGLRSLEMKYRSDEDPSNIFEAFKALLFKHPRIESFKVVKHQIFYQREDSIFHWRNLREPTKMRVEISCYGGDNIHSMFQRYTLAIERLWVAELRLDEAAVLEKSLRSRKGPLALKCITIVDVHLMEPSVRNILQRIILRRDIEKVIVRGKLDPDDNGCDNGQAGDYLDNTSDVACATLRHVRDQNTPAVEVWADFLIAIRSKITELDVRNDPKSRVLKALESQMDDSLDMPRLRSLALSSDMVTSLFSDRWLEALLRSKQELSKLKVPPDNECTSPSTPITTAVNPAKIGRTKETMMPAPTNHAQASQAITELYLHGVKLSDGEWTRLLGYLDFSQLVKFEVLQRTNVPMVVDQHASETYFQTFRAPDEKEPVQIPVVIHPTLNQLYVLWSDISDCFPKATRVQFKDIYVPKLKDTRLYRAKPHGIRYHPGIVLDVVYGERASKKPIKSRSSVVGQEAVVSMPTHTKADGRNEDCTDGDRERLDRNEINGTVALLGSGDELSIGGDDVPGIGDSIGQGYTAIGPSFDTAEQDNGSASGVMAEGNEDINITCRNDVVRMPEAEAEVPAVAGTEVKRMVAIKTDMETEAEEEGEEAAQAASTQAGNHPATIPQTIPNQRTSGPAHPLPTPPNKGDILEPATTPDSTTLEVHTASVNQESHLRISELVANRVKDILDVRYSWWNSYPKFFCFLPVLTRGASTATRPGDTDDKIYNGTKFQVSYLCDCSDITVKEDECSSHWVFDKHLAIVAQEQLMTIIPVIGQFVVAMLEMMKYGVRLGDIVKVSPETNPDIRRRLSLAIRFFEAKGFQSCENYVRDVLAGSSTDMLSSVTPITQDQVYEVWRIAKRKRWMPLNMTPQRIAEGDVRWTCLQHRFHTLRVESRGALNDYLTDELSRGTTFRFEEGAVGFSITSLQRARDVFLQLSEMLPMLSILRLTLQWELTPDHERVLAEAIGQLSAAAVDITAQTNAVQGRSDPELGYGCVSLITAALRNPKLEAFVLRSPPPDNGRKNCIIDEQANIVGSFACFPSGAIATMSRRRGDDSRMKVTLRVGNEAIAVKAVRRMAQGFHNLSQLEFTRDGFDKEFAIKFAAPGSGKPGSDVNDTDYNSGDIAAFFKSRQWCDEIQCVFDVISDDLYLHLRCLTELTMIFTLGLDRATVRELIKMNKGLRTLVLCDVMHDDPSQIFETFKSLLSNHPSMKTFKVQQVHDGRPPSVFTWTNPSEPAKMTVEISCLGHDKVQAMFQRYAPLIESLQIQQLLRDDTAVLEKSFRLKKGPMALRRFTILWADNMEESVLNDLKTIILRRDVDEIRIQSATIPLIPSILQGSGSRGSSSNARKGSRFGEGNKSVSKANGRSGNSALADSDSVLADFVFAVRSKVTSLALYDGNQCKLFESLGLREKESLDMPRLRSIEFTRDWDTTLFGCTWFERLLQSKRPTHLDPSSGAIPGAESALQLSRFARAETITSFNVSHVVILREEWDRLLRYLDFSQLECFTVFQQNDVEMLTLLKLVDTIPADCGRITKLNIFDGQISGDRDSDALSEKFKCKTIGSTVKMTIRGQKFH
ncbi:hypothetical protein BGZ96_007527 [Linnemannia gamsii]|uniref:Uncharacterized protein n=1 Tax=Linnemannia gamsii TaxID=64522 RepID=A0ABQ7K032_9FUNG|nr:hypothetical protein BGZ96_007527 [Linnemannia gamsii]